MLPEREIVAQSPKSLKQQNRYQLAAFVSANVVALGVIVLGWDRVVGLLNGVATGDLAAFSRLVVAPVVVGLAIALATWVVPPAVKECLVFWRSGPNRLPSSRAFSEIAKSDPRVNIQVLKATMGAIPRSAREQSAAWYAIYQRHRDEHSVRDAHGAYLLFRDMCVLVIGLILVCTVYTAISYPVEIRSVGIAFGVLAAEFLLTAIAARNAGRRFVANALAVESAGVVRKPTSKVEEG